MSGLTKILIVLQLVFSLVVSVLLVLMVSKQDNYRDQVVGSQAGLLGLKATLAHQEMQIADLNATNSRMAKDNLDTVTRDQAAMADLTSKNASLEQKSAASAAEVSRLQTANTSLSNTISADKNLIASQNAELGTLRPQVAKLTTETAEVARVNNDLTNQVARDELAIRKLQEAVADATSSKPGASANPVDTGTQVTGLGTGGGIGSQTAVAINGKVTKIDQSPAGTLIETTLGSRDGVKENTRFSVFRNSSYIGDAVVQSVTADQSVAIVKPKRGETVQDGDLVTSGD